MPPRTRAMRAPLLAAAITEDSSVTIGTSTSRPLTVRLAAIPTGSANVPITFSLMWLAAGELHPYGPVRCDGWDAKKQPVGVGVNDPYIPLIAYTEEQSDELAFAALLTILEYSTLADDFDIGLQRIMRIGG